MSFTRQEVLRLVSGDAKAWLMGPPTWRLVNGSWRGEVTVWADHLPPGAVTFYLMTTRANRLSFVLAIRGPWCRRLDVNTPHRNLPSTHMQGRDEPTDMEFALDASDAFPPIPETGTVGGEQYAATFLAYAEHLGISAGAFEWVDPPEGRS
jgi:hypothetical protein